MSGQCCTDSIFPSLCDAAIKFPKNPLTAAGGGRAHLYLLKFLECVQITKTFFLKIVAHGKTEIIW